VEIEDMEWSEELGAFTHQCPCGDLFQITLAELAAGEELAHCPSCSLLVRVVYDPEDFRDAGAGAAEAGAAVAAA
jgi:diphthamide biosynthesis protein 3